MKKIISVFTSFAITLTLFLVFPADLKVSAATKSLTSAQIVNYFNGKVGTSYANGMCLAFVADGFKNLGAVRDSACCAYNYGSSHISSASRDNIPVGADVFFSGPKSLCGVCGSGHIAGHIGVYVGNGEVVHAWSGKVVKTTIAYIEKPGYVYRGWGWHGNITVTDVPVKEGMTISGQTAPSGRLEPGKFFGIYGIITSNPNISAVWGGVTYRNGGYVDGFYCQDFPNFSTYNLHGKFNDELIFNNLPVGYYTYYIYGRDTNNKEYELIKSDFQVGDPEPFEFNASASTININGFETKSVTFSYKNYDGRVSIRWNHADNRATSLEWGEWSNNSIPLNITGYAKGTEVITVTLVDLNSGNIIATKALTVNVSGIETQLIASTNSVSIDMDKDETKSVTFLCKNIPAKTETFNVRWVHSDNRATTLNWSDGWTNNNETTLNISGYRPGSEDITIELFDTKTDEVLAKQVIHVNVAGTTKLIASTNSVSIDMDKNETKSVTFSYKNIPIKTETFNIRWVHSDNRATTLNWSDDGWTDNEITLNISGYRLGSEDIIIELFDTKTDEVLAKQVIHVNVTGTLKITSLEITEKPTKLAYKVNDKIDTSGLKLKAVYNNGETKEITEGFEVSYDFSSVGKKEVTVTYEGKSIKYEVEVTYSDLKINLTDKTQNSIAIEWNEIETADGYKIEMTYSDDDGTVIKKKYNTTETNYKFENLESNDYTIRVSAYKEITSIEDEEISSDTINCSVFKLKVKFGDAIYGLEDDENIVEVPLYLDTDRKDINSLIIKIGTSGSNSSGYVCKEIKGLKTDYTYEIIGYSEYRSGDGISGGNEYDFEIVLDSGVEDSLFIGNAIIDLNNCNYASFYAYVSRFNEESIVYIDEDFINITKISEPPTTAEPIVTDETAPTDESAVTDTTSEENDVVLGDVNNDGKIDLKDVVLIRRYIVGGWDVEISETAADVNHDEKIDLKDVVLIRRYIVGGWDIELNK